MPKFADVLFIADPRFPGGTSTALASEIAAAAEAGLSAALLPVKSRLLKKSWPYHHEIAAQIDAGAVSLMGPGEAVGAAFALVHHPMLFEAPPAAPLNVHAETAVLVLHHPPFDGHGGSNYDLEACVRGVQIAVGATPVLAPVGPLVRAQLQAEGVCGAPLAAEDWHNLIDVRQWRARGPWTPTPGPETPIRIGRHSRPFAPKWPATLDEALRVYPDRRDWAISMLGADADALAEIYGAAPAHWRLAPFGSREVNAYLSELDFYVYFHSSEWVEAFGRAILEAMASGLVVILPDHFQPLFGAGALYGGPDDVEPLIDEFVADPARYNLQSQRARRIASERFGLEQFRPRLERLRPDWAAEADARPAQTPALSAPIVGGRPAKPPAPALFVSSNGVGLGHLTRLLAVADAGADRLDAVFFTLSQGFRLVRETGRHVEYRPFHRTTGADIDAWNDALHVELADVIAMFEPSVLVFDGNMPYRGLVMAMGDFPAMKSVWMRRGFWAAQHAEALKRARHFDAIIEPSDLAGAFDSGPTADKRDEVWVAPPIIRGQPTARLDRTAARAALGAPADGLLVGVTLGSATNFDLSEIRRAIFDALQGHGVDTVIEFVSPIAPEAPAPLAPPPGGDLRQDTRYPLFPLSRAFDFCVSTCGYNSFHEAILGGIPTIFVPNEAAEMDLQNRRAAFAEITGCGLMLRRTEPLKAWGQVGKMLDRERRAAMRAKCAGLSIENGAAAAAAFIHNLALMRATAPLA